MPKVMPVQEWKAALEVGSPTPDVILHKTGVVEITRGAADSRTVDFTISTGAVDREKDVINQEGWDLKHYKKSPVVLFAHDYRQPPIGRTTNLRVVDGALKATVEFASKEANPMAETVYQLVKGGFLSSASVGFRPQKHAMNAERGGVDFEKQELLEWSIVPVPANPEALMDAKGAGVDLGPLTDWAKGILADTEPEADKAPPPMKPGHKPGCTDSQCPGGAACEGKSLPDDLAQRLTRIEAALEKLTAPPVPVVIAPPVEREIVFMLEDEPTGDGIERFTVEPAVFHAAMAEAVGSMVGREVRAAINHLRGRVD